MSAGRVLYYLVAALIAGIAAGSFTYPHIWVACFLYCVLAVCMYAWKRNLLLSFGGLCFAFIGVVIVSQSVDHLFERHDTIRESAQQTFQGEMKTVSVSGSVKHVGVETDEGVISFSSFDQQFEEGMYVSFVCDQFSEEFDLSRASSFGEIATCETTSSVIITKQQHSFFIGVRERLANVLHEALPSPESDIMAGMIIGKQASFPKNYSDIFRATGTSHIMVLSGFNITLLAFAVNTMFRRFRLGLTAGTIASLVIIVLFDVLVGFSAPVLRASIMVALVLIARMRGRPSSSFFALLLSAAVMLIINPLLLRWSISFQLSFAATCGVLFHDRLSPQVLFITDKFGLRDSIRTTFAAIVMTVPITLSAFGGFSTVALVANAAVLPLVPFIMILGIPLLIIGLLSSQAAFVFGAIPFVPLRCMTIFLQSLSRFDFSYVDGLHIPIIFIVCWYIVVGMLAFRKNKQVIRRSTPHVARSFVLSISLSAVALICFVWVLRLPVLTSARVHIFDIGQGDAIHVRLPEGFDLLVDGGPDNSVLSELGRSIPFGDRTIELIIMTHPHADHITGIIDVIEKYQVKEFWFSGVPYESPIYERLRLLLKEKNIQTKIVHTGAEMAVPQQAESSIKIVNPYELMENSDLNNTSIVVQLSIEGKNVLLMGDAGQAVEEKLIHSFPEIAPVALLKVGHHGSATASSQSFIEALRPAIAVVSVGKNNSYALPSEQTISIFRRLGVPLFRTDLCGTVSVDFMKDKPLQVHARCTP